MANLTQAWTTASNHAARRAPWRGRAVQPAASLRRRRGGHHGDRAPRQPSARGGSPSGRVRRWSAHGLRRPAPSRGAEKPMSGGTVAPSEPAPTITAEAREETEADTFPTGVRRHRGQTSSGKPVCDFVDPYTHISCDRDLYERRDGRWAHTMPFGGPAPRRPKGQWGAV